MEDGLSIIMAAYNTADYIEETLNSIQNQSWCQENSNYEILIGVDGCPSTLKKVLEIAHNYKNLRVLEMESNAGTFVTANTLIAAARYNKILRFDSDDILLERSLERLMILSKQADIVKFWYQDLEDGKITNINACALGSVLYDKRVFDKCGGYKNWKCSADYELFERVRLHFTIVEYKNYIYYHRIRQGSLMHSPETSMDSPYRKKVNSTVRAYRSNENIYIEPIKNNYKIVYESNSKKLILI